ncbi:Golgi-associated plant pathogenesis-related protein 1-like [Bombina bombina]|uniref:Golgi-associated plant pathogenesis-related protein 1-like n=1 Tax=Bombina bombina TaxID=8345 RepID=UPI00235AAC70|nr:Golgi-associated plant pathogenesis-related protein 1-like [Bombina bombina]
MGSLKKENKKAFSSAETTNCSCAAKSTGRQTTTDDDCAEPQSVNMAQFENDFLSAHNAYRKRHGSPPLQLSRELSNSAQQWANYLLSIRTMKHSGSGYGENIYYAYGFKELKGQQPVDSWYNEIQYYNFSQPGFAMNTGHFTQVVWKDSKLLGVGVATDGKGLFYCVGQYSPAGNVMSPGYFERNVLPATA